MGTLRLGKGSLRVKEPCQGLRQCWRSQRNGEEAGRLDERNGRLLEKRLDIPGRRQGPALHPRNLLHCGGLSYLGKAASRAGAKVSQDADVTELRVDGDFTY